MVVWGAWAGLLEHPDRPFSPNYSLVLPGTSAYGFCPDFTLMSFLLVLSNGIIIFDFLIM